MQTLLKNLTIKKTYFEAGLVHYRDEIDQSYISDIENLIEHLAEFNLKDVLESLNLLENRIVTEYKDLSNLKNFLKKKQKIKILNQLDKTEKNQIDLYNKRNIFSDNYIQNLNEFERKLGNCPKITKRDRDVYESLNNISAQVKIALREY